jgi:carboxypeptidase Q
MRIIILAICLFTISTNHSSAQNKDSVIFRNISNDILRNGSAYNNLRILCKQIGPRLSGSIQQQKAEKETARMMKEMGADTVYMQSCMVPHWVRGEKEVAQLINVDGKNIPLNICALGNSIGTGKNGIKANIVEVNSFEQMDQLGEKGLKGKIVFINVYMDPTHVLTDDAYTETSPFRWKGPSRAAKYGAIATMIRSLASNPDDYPHTGGMSYNDSFPKIPAVAVSTNDADRITKELRKRKELQVFLRTTSETLPDVVAHNVIGEIRGSEFPDEIITVGGHLDSWDLAEGAQDDGAGCVQSMELIRVYKKLGMKPRRTIRIVLFTDEENRGSGNKKYFELAKAEKKKHVFALESDDGGFVPRGFRFMLSEEKLEKLRAWLPLFNPYGVYLFINGEAGADVEPLEPLGLVLAGLLPDSQRYFDHHHAAIDRFEAVSKRELELGAINMANLVYMMDQYGLQNK